jgi:hypothetical protein
MMMGVIDGKTACLFFETNWVMEIVDRDAFHDGKRMKSVIVCEKWSGVENCVSLSPLAKRLLVGMMESVARRDSLLDVMDVRSYQHHLARCDGVCVRTKMTRMKWVRRRLPME